MGDVALPRHDIIHRNLQPVLLLPLWMRSITLYRSTVEADQDQLIVRSGMIGAWPDTHIRP